MISCKHPAIYSGATLISGIDYTADKTRCKREKSYGVDKKQVELSIKYKIEESYGVNEKTSRAYTQV
jgi:hypothetical protein